MHPSKWLAFLLIPLLLGADVPGITITAKAPTIERKKFDPGNPPPQMPKLEPPEAGVCSYNFGCESRMGCTIEPQEGDQARVTIDSVNVTTTLSITIWTAQDAPKKVLDHEEAHRIIAEHYYKDIEAIARKFAGEYIGKTYTAKGKDLQVAANEILHNAITEMNQKIMGQTQVPCARAQQRFDEITEHGTNRLKEATAIDLAIRWAAENPPKSN